MGGFGGRPRLRVDGSGLDRPVERRAQPLRPGRRRLGGRDDGLNGSYAIDTLLNSGPPIQVGGYQSQPQANQAAAELTQVAQTAQTTAAGRARLALAGALSNLTIWTAVNIGGWDTNLSVTSPLFPPGPTAYDLWEQEQYETAFAPGSMVVSFGTGTGWEVDQAEGGQPTSNAGVNYATVLASSPYLNEVTALYKEAGLNLTADLQTLTADADITANPTALSNFIATSDPTGVLQVPALDIHTISDQLTPVQQENYYAQLVNAAGDGAMLGQAYLFRQGHCNINAAEVVAGVEALQQRITAGSWGTLLAPSSLNAAADALNIGRSAFISYSPPPLHDRGEIAGRACQDHARTPASGAGRAHAVRARRAGAHLGPIDHRGPPQKPFTGSAAPVAGAPAQPPHVEKL